MQHEKKNILTYEGLQKYEQELHELKVVKRQEVAQKIVIRMLLTDIFTIQYMQMVKPRNIL